MPGKLVYFLHINRLLTKSAYAIDLIKRKYIEFKSIGIKLLFLQIKLNPSQPSTFPPHILLFENFIYSITQSPNFRYPSLSNKRLII